MANQFDLVIRCGLVVDGTGAEPVEADIAVVGGRIVAVGKVPGGAREEIVATGHIVTPGFVDIHRMFPARIGRKLA